MIVPADGYGLADADRQVERQHRTSKCRGAAQAVSERLQFQRDDPATVNQVAPLRKQGALPHRHSSLNILLRRLHWNQPPTGKFAWFPHFRGAAEVRSISLRLWEACV